MRHDELYIADLVDSTRAVREYLDGISREHWDQDRVLRDAVLYRLLLLVRSQVRSREEVPVLEEQAMDIMRAEFPELAKTDEPETTVEPGPDDTAEPGQEQTA